MYQILVVEDDRNPNADPLFLCSAGVEISFELVGAPHNLGQDHVEFGIDPTQFEQMFCTEDGKTICLSLSVSLHPIEDAVSVLLLVLSLVLVLWLLLSAAAAGGTPAL